MTALRWFPVVNLTRSGVRKPTREALALALPEHRYCDTQVRGHETCLAVADGILRRLGGGR